MADVRVPLAVALSAFGLPATVKTKDDTTIVTTGFWLTAVEESSSPRSDMDRRDPQRRVFVVPRTDVPSPQRGTYLFAAEYAGGPVCRWRFNGIDVALEPDAMRLFVSLDPEISA